MDASIRYTTSNIDEIFHRAKLEGVLAKFGNENVIVNHTVKPTFEMLKTDPQLYEGRVMFATGFVVVRATPYITKYILRPWISCALTLGCMVPTKRAVESKLCLKGHEKPFSCHRFDQSVLSILFHMLYGDNALRHLICWRQCKYYTVCRSCKQIGVLEKRQPSAKRSSYRP